MLRHRVMFSLHTGLAFRTMCKNQIKERQFASIHMYTHTHTHTLIQAESTAFSLILYFFVFWHNIHRKYLSSTEDGANKKTHMASR
uniref:Uncharacterized protein n=1 Tax=Anguilla anguilla TaxID=7936 RepID=A0A0E9WZP3_ANGAN